MECMACGYVAPGDEDMAMRMIMAHQAVCPKLEPEKREFREAIVRFTYGENAEAVLEAAHAAWGVSS